MRTDSWSFIRVDNNPIYDSYIWREARRFSPSSSSFLQLIISIVEFVCRRGMIRGCHKSFRRIPLTIAIDPRRNVRKRKSKRNVHQTRVEQGKCLLAWRSMAIIKLEKQRSRLEKRQGVSNISSHLEYNAEGQLQPARARTRDLFCIAWWHFLQKNVAFEGQISYSKPKVNEQSIENRVSLKLLRSFIGCHVPIHWRLNICF